MPQINRFLQQLDVGRCSTIDERKTVTFPRLVIIRILHEWNVFRIGKSKQIIALSVALDIGKVFFRHAAHLFRCENHFGLVIPDIARKFLIDFGQSCQNLLDAISFVCRKRNACIFIGADDILTQFSFFVIIHTHDAHIPVKLFILEHIGNETLNIHGTGIGIFPHIGVWRDLA